MLNKSRLSLIFMGVIFIGPMILAWVLANHGQGVIAMGGAVKGTLLEMAQPLKPFSIKDLSGSIMDQEIFKGKWTFVTFSSGECLQVCQDNLYKMRQVRLTQGKNMNRIQRLIFLNPAFQQQFKSVLADHTGLMVGLAELNFNTEWEKQFMSVSADSNGHIFMVDPLGNLFIYYSQDADPTGMRKDLKRLLKASHIG
jgi:cytochrome oxidase Cu insertion factor (SCO1/SenC/PrrC family)